MPLTRHVNAFKQFATGHLTGDPDHDYYINLKIDHSLRVLENARTILEGEGIHGHEAYLCLLAALYHDIGRFPQFATYGTYRDADSANHGRLGVLAMRRIDLPEGPSDADWRIIRAAIGLHNTKKLNPRLPGLLSTVTKVVRDADKIDIYPVIISHMTDTSDSTRAVIHHLKDEPEKYTDIILNTVMAGEIGDYGLLQYANDFLLLITGWIFTLNYNTSLNIIARSGMVEEAFLLLPKNNKIQKLKAKVDKFMRYNDSTPS